MSTPRVAGLQSELHPQVQEKKVLLGGRDDALHSRHLATASTDDILGSGLMASAACG